MSADTRSEILLSAYERNALQCAEFGHRYVPDHALNGDYSCGYCRAAKALTPPQDNDQTMERLYT